MSPGLGSDEPVPSSVTGSCSPTVWSGPAFATGGAKMVAVSLVETMELAAFLKST